MTERQLLKLKVARLTTAEIREVLDYIAIMEAMRRSEAAHELNQQSFRHFIVDTNENRLVRGVNSSAKTKHTTI